MQQKNVDAIDLERFKARLDRRDELLFRVIVGMHFGGDTKLVTGNTTFGQRLACVGLVGIHLRRVECPIADVDCGVDCASKFAPLQRIGAEAALKGLLEVDVHASPLFGDEPASFAGGPKNRAYRLVLSVINI